MYSNIKPNLTNPSISLRVRISDLVPSPHAHMKVDGAVQL